MTTFIFTNDLSTQLAAAVSNTATSITLASSSNVPTIPSGYMLPITLNDAATGQVYEVMYATAASGATLTVLRAQEGTGAQSWAIGDYVFSTQTAGTTAPVNGNPGNVFQVDTAVTSTDAVPLGQMQSLGIANNPSVYATSTTLTAANAGQIIFYTGSAAGTFTLPLASAASGYTMKMVISNQSEYPLTIVTQSGDATDIPINTLQPDQYVAFVNDGGVTWHTLWNTNGTTEPFVVGNATASNEAVAFGQSFASSTNHNVTSSRSLGTVYTNTTGKTMIVSAMVEGLYGNSGFGGLNLLIDGSPWNGFANGATSSDSATVLGPVPAGSTYETTAASSGAITLYAWNETY